MLICKTLYRYTPLMSDLSIDPILSIQKFHLCYGWQLFPIAYYAWGHHFWEMISLHLCVCGQSFLLIDEKDRDRRIRDWCSIWIFNPKSNPNTVWIIYVFQNNRYQLFLANRHSDIGHLLHPSVRISSIYRMCSFCLCVEYSPQPVYLWSNVGSYRFYDVA